MIGEALGPKGVLPATIFELTKKFTFVNQSVWYGAVRKVGRLQYIGQLDHRRPEEESAGINQRSVSSQTFKSNMRTVTAE